MLLETGKHKYKICTYWSTGKSIWTSGLCQYATSILAVYRSEIKELESVTERVQVETKSAVFMATLWSWLRDLGSTPTLYHTCCCILSLLGGFEQAAIQQFSGKKSKKQLENSKRTTPTVLSGFGFIQNIASPSLSRDGWIKMEQTN